MARRFQIGERVMMVPSCPIESEGVAPGAGDHGEIVAPPGVRDVRRCWMVRFDRHSLSWRIPEQFLDTATAPQTDAGHDDSA